jgi:hypothetical protein
MCVPLPFLFHFGFKKKNLLKAHFGSILGSLLVPRNSLDVGEKGSLLEEGALRLDFESSLVGLGRITRPSLIKAGRSPGLSDGVRAVGSQLLM